MTGRAGTVAGALGALAAVVVLDLALAARSWSIPVEAVLDEPAHLVTAWLLLTAVGVRSRQVVVWALAGAVLIDLDHLPLYAGFAVTAGGGRPVSHSVTAVLVLLVAAGVWRAQRTRLAALALGVVLHLVRDLGSGPGVPVLWPWLSDSLRVPYVVYLAVLVAAVAVVAVRAWRNGAGATASPGRTTPGSPPRRQAG
ncbi:metal-dependent hydrolase [Geodermatophilus normandii]|uniref:Metal-dependent hydrolase n=1 Tax=Geodermatophilus normandii TaxID=1137989 RepID=A0A6P0GFD7_9ACTN|nr:metal-dependent hydrolase [Geodermatophilus normandii]